jgi:RNA polymerase sigma-70 factor (ECF subfamily)
LAGVRDYLLIIANREVTGAVAAKMAPSDVVQETLFQAHRKLADFVGSSEAQFLAWLRAILINQVQLARRTYQGTQARDIRRERSLADLHADAEIRQAMPAAVETPSRFAIANERLEIVASVLSRLPADYQRVLRLRYWEQLPLETIAREMGRTPAAVQKLWFRAIEQVKRELHREGTE